LVRTWGDFKEKRKIGVGKKPRGDVKSHSWIDPL